MTPPVESRYSEQQLIRFENVSKFYGEVLGVNRVNLQVAPGVTSLVGPNGAGKTTLMNLMTGLITPTRGRIRVLGIPASDPERFFRTVGYCTQFDSFPRGVTGREFVYDGLRLHGLPHRQALAGADEAIERVNMTDAANRKVAGYSKGMRQKVLIAAALMHDPQLVLLDEPFSGLDVGSALVLRSLIHELALRGKVVLFSSHELDTVERICSRVVILHRGKLVADDTIVRLRSLMELPTLEGIFSQLAVEQDTDSMARQIADLIRA